MWPNPQFPEDLVTFTEEILDDKLYFLCNVYQKLHIHKSISQDMSNNIFTAKSKPVTCGVNIDIMNYNVRHFGLTSLSSISLWCW